MSSSVPDTCPEPAHPEFWTVHVHGPDDLVFCDSEDEARGYEAAITDLTREGRPLAPMSPDDPTVSAHVIPPASEAS